MTSISEDFTAEHRFCDEAFIRIEQLAHQGDWSAARRAAGTFIGVTEAHLRREEERLFPALEAAAPMANGPTSVMRAEHAQMRELFAAIDASLAAQDADNLGDAVDTLLLLMQQHNAKEETVLYPLADQLIPEPQALD
jgi:hemerythrin-like domain-containing protein